MVVMESSAQNWRPGQRNWRRLTRTWKSVGEQIVEARNEIEAQLEEGRMKLSSVLSDLIGAGAMRVLRALAEGETDPRCWNGLLDLRVRASEKDRLDALLVQLASAQRLKRFRTQFRKSGMELPFELSPAGAGPGDFRECPP